MKKILTRLRNKKIALSVASGILLILVQTGVIGLEMSQTWDVVINTGLGVLVALGIVSDPESHVDK
jgi:uncharacterized membrane protein